MILIRHGDKAYKNNAEVPYRLDSPLTKKGKWRARCTCLNLLGSYPPPKRLIVSPYLRTRETANMFRKMLEKNGINVTIIESVLVSECLVFQKKPITPQDFRVKTQYIIEISLEEYSERVANASSFLEEGDWVITHGFFITELAKQRGVKKTFGFCDYFVI